MSQMINLKNIVDSIFTKFLEQQAPQLIENWENNKDEIFSSTIESPKRSKNAYQLFMADERQRIKDNGEVLSEPVITVIARRWALFKEEAKVDDSVAFLKMKEYKGNAEQLKITKSVKTKKVSSVPKRGKTAYAFYCELMKDEVSKTYSGRELRTQLNSQWNDLKVSYLEADRLLLDRMTSLSAADKERYQREMKQFEETEDGMAIVARKKIERVKGKKNKGVPKYTEEQMRIFDAETETDSDGEEKKKEEMPKKKVQGYSLYCKENRQIVKTQNPGLKALEITKILSSNWKTLSKEEKKRYK